MPRAKSDGKSDVESGIWFVQRAGKEKPEEHQEVNAQIPPNTRPYNSAAAGIDRLCRSLCFRRLRCRRSRRRRRRCGLRRLPFGNFCHRPVEMLCCYKQSYKFKNGLSSPKRTVGYMTWERLCQDILEREIFARMGLACANRGHAAAHAHGAQHQVGQRAYQQVANR